LAGIAVGATVMLNILVAGYVHIKGFLRVFTLIKKFLKHFGFLPGHRLVDL